MGSDQKQPRRSYIAPTPAPSPMGSPFLGRVAEDVCGSETETKVIKVSKMIVCQIKCVENNEIIVNLITFSLWDTQVFCCYSFVPTLCVYPQSYIEINVGRY